MRKERTNGKSRKKLVSYILNLSMSIITLIRNDLSIPVKKKIVKS